MTSYLNSHPSRKAIFSRQTSAQTFLYDFIQRLLDIWWLEMIIANLALPFLKTSLQQFKLFAYA